MMTEPVLFEVWPARQGKAVAVATLNVEKSLNALSLEMIELLSEQLDAWEEDDSIAMVVLQGAGEQAFCAGGDIVKLYQSMVEHGHERNPYAESFFEQEYRLDYLIHTYTKPVLCWGHGIVMGGGVGLMAGASHRVVTEKSRIAMPEITIGLYPDVGGSWFLNRMPGRVGLYLGLTGAHLNAADALFVKLADYCVSSQKKADVMAALCEVPWSEDYRHNHQQLSQLLRAHRHVDALPESPVRRHLDFINQVTDADSVEEIATALVAHAGEDAWIQRGINTFQKGSPTSAKLIYDIYRHAAHMSLEEAFAMELGLSVQCCLHHDFREGVRALLIDRDNRPAWSPATLDAVTEAHIDGHYLPPWGSAEHPFADW
ncbi:enoyl-CoA hydratase/carnithine racemase [Chitinivorax tropicus]|uniref:3-hydroxyisobutyryl-CoA hydrolase n=1 Tax=Chitinivorax tropicus TaxID=714531 RepID=A0A840MJM1_9PROT|nr:enoyl-CoA hydratase/isomerase family protein [Chitinivorax tropicus]MBB5017695.1 enoyl-CoA hydratase/carnithine racemase [Chitinivorax tropicus]